ncbi:hypothetical protein PHLCEN_2v12021 [Hermanssonia centrifuga]|uniref:Uncharacterized protein n=1 Tax=Hermanssonia centrifuga TaxID=98765 RepID=A0A2R6NIA1_9APHY|nr:hypothetical protein PHLCEN_2v12021 [Hermanssonia centrifuga]
MTDCRTLVPWEYTDNFDETKLGDALIFNNDDSQCTSVSSPYGLKKTYYTIISDGQETHIYRGNGKAGVIKGRSTHIATVSAARSRASAPWSLFRHKPVPKVMLDNNDGLWEKPAEGEVMDAEGSFAKSSWYGEERFEPVEKDTYLYDEKSSPLYSHGVQPGKKESQRKTNREMILRVPATAIPDDVFLIRFGRGASAATKASLKVGGQNSYDSYPCRLNMHRIAYINHRQSDDRE